MNSDMEFMDLDGPEFIADVNNQIASFRQSTLTVHSIDASDFVQYKDTQSLDAYQEICVLDTNFLLSKLGYLDAVLDLAAERPGSLLVMLPWVVVRELDGLNKQGTSDVGINARKAMRFIEMKLRDKVVSLRGQKMNEVWDKAILKKSSVKGDDRILDCCIYFQQTTQKHITLLSNDRNLCIKVMVHDIDSVSAEKAESLELLLKRIVSYPALPGATTSLQSVLQPPSRQYNHRQYQQPQQHQQYQPQHQQPQHQQQQQPAYYQEDYGMDIDDTYTTPQIAPTYTMDEDDAMMTDDDRGISAQLLQSWGGSAVSKWAAGSTATDSNAKGRRRRNFDDAPAYLDGDPTLTAPRRPFRPQHVSYDRY